MVGSGMLPGLGSLIKTAGFLSNVLLVSNPNVYQLFGSQVLESLNKAGFRAVVALVPEGEQAKSLEEVGRVIDQAVDGLLDRHSGVVALGGGVIGDLAGFVAATYMRGIPFIQVPTTLLAQVDSSVGGKVAVNHEKGKNLIGAFHQPRLVVADLLTLNTLPAREVRAGLAEVIKYGIIADGEFFKYLENHISSALALQQEVMMEIVVKSCAIKARVVGQDEREEGLRAILNFGHTIGHAVEVLGGYQGYLHGEAVAIGMVAATRMAAHMGICSQRLVSRLENLLRAAGLPTEIPADMASEAIIQAVAHDKKAVGGTLRFVLPETAGRVKIVSLDQTELSHLLSILRGTSVLTMAGTGGV